ncbi:MAG: hypothetical protein KAR35_04985 [Candidatus Heimdallarchaeota archaeon]|nr:hypothetical protein [Candidatus Heimdallarchaeota archaeon]MCK5048711.1 hypothetical protein [Candidatus Heimdallarchaeota archaeon]
MNPAATGLSDEDPLVTYIKLLTGFNGSQAKVYVAVIQGESRPELPAGVELAGLAGVPRSKIYGILNELESLQAIERIPFESGARYRAMPFDEYLVTKYDAFKEALETTKSTLKELQTSGYYKSWDVLAVIKQNLKANDLNYDKYRFLISSSDDALTRFLKVLREEGLDVEDKSRFPAYYSLSFPVGKEVVLVGTYNVMILRPSPTDLMQSSNEFEALILESPFIASLIEKFLVHHRKDLQVEGSSLYFGSEESVLYSSISLTAVGTSAVPGESGFHFRSPAKLYLTSRNLIVVNPEGRLQFPLSVLNLKAELDEKDATFANISFNYINGKPGEYQLQLFHDASELVNLINYIATHSSSK